MKRTSILFSALFFTLITDSAFAEEIYCEGQIEDWEVARWGTLYIDGTWNETNTSQGLCKLDGSMNDVSAETCKVWVMAVQEATKNGTKVKLKYLNVASCKSEHLGEWGEAKTPEYIRVYAN